MHILSQAIKENRLQWRLLFLLVLVLVGLSITFFAFESQIYSWVLPHLPYSPRKTVYFYMDLFRLVSAELLWYAGFITLFLLIVVYVPLSRLRQVIGRMSSTKSAIAAIAVGFLLIVGIAYYILDRFPNSGDEYVYLYQAKTMAHGKLYEQAHDLPQFFHFNHIAQKDGISVGRFPPGWPVLLSISFYLNFPAWIVDPILALISVVVFYRFANRQYSDNIAFCAVMAFMFTSHFLFFSGSFFSHTSCTLAIVAFISCLYRYKETGLVRFAIAAGFFLGFAAIIRYFTAFLIFLPFAVMLLVNYRVKAIKIFFWIGMGALPCMLFLFWYNYSITGDFRVPVTLWAYPNEALGFVKGHTPLKGIEHLVRRIAMFLYWASPALLVLYIVYLLQKLRSKAERLEHVEDYAYLLLTVGYFFYYEIGGDQYGPRFLIEAFPFMALFVARKVWESRSHWAMALFTAGCIYAVAKIPVVAQREHVVIKERTDLFTQVEKRHLDDAVVMISSLVSDIRPMPVGDLTRNQPPFQSDVLFVFDIPEKDQALFDYYPNREFYRYQWLPGHGKGSLVKVKSRSANVRLAH